MKLHHTLLATAAFAGLSLPATAAVIFSENFESFTVGTQPNRPNVSIATSGTASPSNTALVATGPQFGLPADNQFLTLTDTTTTGGIRYLISGGGVSSAGADGFLSVQFDLFEPSDATDGPLNVRLAEQNNTTFAGPDLNFNNGTVTAAGNTGFSATYAVNAPVSVTVVADENTDTFALFFGETLVNPSLAFRNTGVDLNQVAFQTTNAGLQVASIDNVVISNINVIPEPAAASAVAVLGGLLLRRRRN